MKFTHLGNGDFSIELNRMLDFSNKSVLIKHKRLLIWYNCKIIFYYEIDIMLIILLVCSYIFNEFNLRNEMPVLNPKVIRFCPIQKFIH